MRIKKWDKFQHYKKRCPPWIKLYRALIDEPEWFALTGDASKMLVMCWLIASEDNGNLPPVATLAFRMRMSINNVEKIISQLNHWLTLDASTALATCRQDAMPETETETETETEAKRKKPAKSLLPDSWTPHASHFDLGASKGLSVGEIEEAVDEMRSWSLGNGERRTNWDWVFNNWLRRKAQKRGGGYAKSAGSSAESGRKLAAIAKQIIDEQHSPRPDDGETIVGAGGETVRLLPER